MGLVAAAGWTLGEFLAAAFTVGSFAYTIGSAIQARDPTSGRASQDPGVKTNTRSTKEPLRVLYGTLRVGGNDVYMGTSGSSNNILWVVQSLSEGECEGIVEKDGEPQIFLGDKLISEYGSYASYTFYAGTAAQNADPDLVAATQDQDVVDDRWSDPLRYTCYIVYKFVWDRNYFQGLPQRTVELKGRRIYDFRDGSTAYSTNPVLCLYDYITNSRYGRGKSASTIDIPSWTSAADYCDSKGWSVNFLIKDEHAKDVVDKLRMIFRGTLVWWDGKYYLRYADLNEESTCLNLEDKHILRDAEGKAVISLSQPSKFGIHDGLRINYIDAEKSYNEDSILIGEEAGNIGNITLDGVTDRETAGKIGTYLLEREQLSRSVSGIFRDDAVRLEAHDLVTLKSTALSIPMQTMRVMDANIQQGGLIELTLMYEDLTLYNDVYDIQLDDIYDSSLPDPNDPPPAVSNGSITEETYDYRLRTFVRLLVSFNQPADYTWFDHVEVYIKIDDGEYEHAFNATTDFNIDPVEDGATYYIRLKAVSIWGVKQDDSNDLILSHLVGGQTAAPSSLSALYAIVNANCINLYATKVSDPDVEVYEFRLGSSWSGGIFLAALRAPNMSLYGVKPGAHTFWCNTLATNGEYGETPVSAAVTLLAPPDGWTQVDSKSDDYTAGTHDNTEHTTYSGDDYLKCSHGGESLTGTYTSPIFDLLSSTRFLVYIEAEIVVTGEGTTWDDVIPLVFAGSDLVANGGMENWTASELDDWEESGVTASEDANGQAGKAAKLSATQDDGYLWQRIAVSGETWHRVDLYYSGETAELGVYDATNNEWITPDGFGFLSEASGWSDADYLFKTPSGCNNVDLRLGCSLNGEVVRFDTVSMQKVDEINSAAWDDIDLSKTWTQIFELTAGAKVEISLKYGDVSPPTNQVDKMELLSAITTGRYFQVQIGITDPSDAINAMVKKFTMYFCEAN